MNSGEKIEMNKEEEIKIIYLRVKDKIEKRLKEFENIWEKGGEEDIFAELVFCILTPQSKAKLCWQIVENIDKNLILNGSAKQIAGELNRARFKNKKSEYVVKARKLFLCNGKINIKSKINQFNNVDEKREWLVHNVKGIGYKEASHFLRNVGMGKNIAILDRHILKNLKFFGVISEIPNSLSRKNYFNIELKMRKFSENLNIPMNHLDLLFWYKENGVIFK
jgi:N-glycosylase/DNA lyase